MISGDITQIPRNKMIEVKVILIKSIIVPVIALFIIASNPVSEYRISITTGSFHTT